MKKGWNDALFRKKKKKKSVKINETRVQTKKIGSKLRPFFFD